NGVNGVEINSSGTSGNVVLGNFIGTDQSGTAKLGNGNDGVMIITGAISNNTIGGTATGARNLISGNSGNGDEIKVAGTSGNVVLGNFIGTDQSGTAKLGNTNDGVKIAFAASSNTIGGTGTGAGNLISANGTNGVELSIGASSGNVVLGNK